MPENPSSRWWEFFVVRYFLGDMFGGLGFFFCGGGAPPMAGLEGLHLVPIKLDKTQMTLLVTYGLVYCYIASASILVFHATRFLLDYSVDKGAWLWWLLRYVMFPVTVAGG